MNTPRVSNPSESRKCLTRDHLFGFLHHKSRFDGMKVVYYGMRGMRYQTYGIFFDIFGVVWYPVPLGKREILMQFHLLARQRLCFPANF